MILNKSNLIISFCLLASFICAINIHKIPRFSKEGEKYFVHLFFDNDRLKFEKCLIYRDCDCCFGGGPMTFDVPFTIQTHLLGNEFKFDVSSLDKKNTHVYKVLLFKNSLEVLYSDEFIYNENVDSFLRVGENYKLMHEDTTN
ncbi:hypothetical protein NBO_355g0003 [Nosema bombycis CQ1]|uniref:Uncharacterized protein n=1 Tax=Nosema bombycis (strain CQ1 / CVCC 102059) TaxID=578461 RepID=R0MFE5_NOSB1|nr:hypothetical protein NBO_355g0003 [Nosema bombycis CQ1]|eukprot:EOB12855.1 hypothetical protein NBO_355g0003 [Nosema bombycis CQ1]